ncbi:ABC transporter permease [Bacillus sp. JJ1532]|uniref:ABC transporter permease n=1 Tax=Bacillus sp. JJ1532 TaxID=3122958 RepID=UPI003000528D
MFAYLLKRILSTIPVIFVVSVVIFMLIHLTPGDPASYILGNEATEEQIKDLREQLGLNEPLINQYVNWLGNLIQGDLGFSYATGDSVGAMIINNIWPTLSLAILAELIAISIAIPLGIIAALRRGTMVDQTVMGLSLMGMAVPGFLLALIFILFFGVELRWFPVAGYAPLSSGWENHLRFLIMPAVALGAIQAALIARMTRSSMLEVLNKNYIKMARSKGVSETRMLFNHALQNAFMPILTVIGQTFGVLVTGAVIIETIFNIPGIGQLIINSIERRDYTVIQGVVLFVTLAYVSINLIIDLLYGVIDPKVRLE